jgi:hypothetical protein
MLMTAAIWGIAIAGFGLTRTLWLTLSLLAVAGAADTTSVIFRGTILQVEAALTSPAFRASAAAWRRSPAPR